MNVEAGVGLQPVIERDDVQNVQVLPLVFVNPLDLHVEHGVGVDSNAGAAVGDAGQLELVGTLDGTPITLKNPIVSKLLQISQASEVLGPSTTDGVADQLGQPGIGQSQPAPRSNAVCLAAELLRPQLVEVLQHVLLQELRVQISDTIYG